MTAHVYQFINNETGEIMAYTVIEPDDYSDEELGDDDIADARLEAAIQDGYLPDVDFNTEDRYIKSFTVLYDYCHGLKEI